MNDRFARVKELLLEVADLGERERQAHLDDACKDDPELRHEVDAILAHDGDSGLLKSTDRSTQVSRRVPEQIASYRIVRVLGEGGMGVVYEAEQQSPRRPVALKVVRGGPYVDEHRVRLFQREAQTLARLKHPSIAAIYEADRTEEGQHFFAMELVRGVTLHDYVKERQLQGSTAKGEIRSRLALFLQIGHAISYAHQRGVIHRDLKPSNVLVLSGADTGSSTGSSERQAQIKILDFGLARITDADVAMTTVVTEAGQLQGTLPYMSPEQARGNPDEIDVRSDVYSLGVMLYELVTGRLPYDVSGSAIHEAVRVICEEEPAKPSTIARTLRGDLETIALKALEKEPGRRYQSVAALAEDIDRYLTDQPILARPPSATYQLRKLVARHRYQAIFVGSVIAILAVLGVMLAAFGFMAVLVVILAAFAITMSVMFGVQRAERKRADCERDRAVREGKTTDLVTATLEEMLVSVDPTKSGRDATVRAMLDETAKTLGERFKDQPLVEARLRHTVGKTYHALGEYDAAEKHLQKAVQIRRERLGEDHPQTLATVGSLAGVLRLQGRHGEAEAHYRRTLETQRRVLGEEDPEALNTMSGLATSYHNQGRVEEAEALLKRTLELQRRVLGREHESSLETMLSLATVYIHLGRYDAMAKVYMEGLEISRRVLSPEHPTTLGFTDGMATAYAKQGRLEEAESIQRTLLNTCQRVFGDEHQKTNAYRYNLACGVALQGRSSEAVALLREAANHGFWAWWPSLHEDPDLASLHGDPEFEAIVEELKRRNEKGAAAEQAGGAE